MKWIELNIYPDGGKIHIHAEQISSLVEAEDRTHTVVWFSVGHKDGQQAVEETPEQIIAKIKAADNI